MKKILLILLAILFIQLSPIPCFAEELGTIESISPANEMTTFLNTFETKMSDMTDKLINYAKNLFALLALIQFIYNIGMLIIHGKTDMQSFTSTLLRQIMIIGIFYFLLSNGPGIFNKIIESFSVAASKSGNFSEKIDPISIYNTGITLATKLGSIPWAKAASLTGETTDPAHIYMSMLCFLLTTSFAMITAIYTLVMIKGYFICTAGMLFLGFGGSEWSSDIAKSTLKAVACVGAETFAILVIASIATKTVNSWSSYITSDMSKVQFTAACGPISTMTFILATLSVALPSLATGLISGSMIGAGGAEQAAGMIRHSLSGRIQAAAIATSSKVSTDGSGIPGGRTKGANTNSGASTNTVSPNGLNSSGNAANTVTAKSPQWTTPNYAAKPSDYDAS